MSIKKFKYGQRISMTSKNANKKQWYKDHYEYFTNHSSHYNSEKIRRQKINYDLINGIINEEDLIKSCKPYGLPKENIKNISYRDILSPKIKAIQGMESKTPFPYKIMAINPEATTRKEQEIFNRIKESVQEEIVSPIREAITQQEMGKIDQIDENTIQQIQQSIEEKVQKNTPDTVKRYMLRKYQDPVEKMAQHLVNILKERTDARNKFNKIFKHATVSGEGVGYVGIFNGHPDFWVVNPMRITSDENPDLEFIHKGEWARVEYPMTPSQIIDTFGDELSKAQIDLIYDSWEVNHVSSDDLFSYDFEEEVQEYNNTIKVVHTTWKAPRKMGFLKYRTEKGKIRNKYVSETYVQNPEAGDISIEWRWLPEVYEDWCIEVSEKIHIKQGPVPNQYRSDENPNICYLPYYGVKFDYLNSNVTSLVDRAKTLVYFYTIINYKFEKLVGSDKGKKILMNIKSIPKSAGFDLKKWQYYVEESPYIYFDPSEEGMNMSNSKAADVIDLSYAGDMNKYIGIMEDIRRQLGVTLGIPEAVEGQIAPREAVRNTQQSLIQTSNILEPYFNLHNQLKKEILYGLYDCAVTAYSGENNYKMSYMMDDMGLKILEIDFNELSRHQVGIYLLDSANVNSVREEIKTVGQAAMQNQTINFSDYIEIIRQNDIIEAKETIKLSEQEKLQQAQDAERQKAERDKELLQIQEDNETKKHEREKEIIILKEEERRKTEIVKGGLIGASYNADVDNDNDGVNDFVEIAQSAAEIRFKEKQLEHTKDIDNKKIAIEEKKLLQKNK